MAHFKFHIDGPDLTFDDIEVELPDRRRAWSEAVKTAAGIIYDLEPSNHSAMPFSMVVTDDCGHQLWVMQFRTVGLAE